MKDVGTTSEEQQKVLLWLFENLFSGKSRYSDRTKMSFFDGKLSLKSAWSDLCETILESIKKKGQRREDFFKAVSEYDYRKLSEFIKCMGTPDIPNEAGETPLHLASIDGCSFERDQHMTRFLIENGADFLLYCRNSSSTPAAYIFQYEDQTIIDILLSKMENVNEPLDVYKNTALHISVKIGNITTVLKLLKKGADPNQRNVWRKAPMHEAISSRGGEDILDILVHYGGDVNIRGQLGMRPLHLVALSKDGAMLDNVLRFKPDVNARDENRNTPLALFLMDKENLETVEIYKYIQAGADLTLLDQRGMNVLHRLVRCSSVPNMEELVTDLIDWGLNIDAKTSGDQNTALHLAAQTSKKIVVHILLSNGADLYVQNSRGRTALDNAIFAERLDVIEVIFSFAVQRHIPMDNLMLDYHRTTHIFESVSLIYNRCMAEFQRCQTMEIRCTYPRIRYSNLLSLSDKKFAGLLRNKELLEELERNIDNFSSFNYSFRRVLQKAKVRRDAEDAAVIFLQMVWDYRLPVLCIEEIVSLLSTKELMPYTFL
ncbi:E3 ubiquitin-protein ligase HACE1-like isoform X2 [Coccinella septempunctata]|uniref:E3 ubiquitin-protein ligase HACE1-like isoform X2 n=1 Tax=Coccinella septempunctata TaxID=41139 RepID=UPI001D0971CE|nr:E3 ubiquitin-protein ligase HACE1-like isoform X2 [Coccinella septempunctata]